MIIFIQNIVCHTGFTENCAGGGGNYAVIRTVSVYDNAASAQLTGAIVRLGSSSAGLVADFDGGIDCGISLVDGTMFSAKIRKGDSEGVILGKNLIVHPDTGKALDGLKIPDFDRLKKLIIDVSNYLPVTPYLVMDIIQTDEGFKILEINSHGQVKSIEPWYPFNKNEYNKKVLRTRDW